MNPKRWIIAVLLSAFGRLPLKARHLIVGWSSPAYRVGTVAIIGDGQGKILLVRHAYRDGWGLPGGMLGWREEPEETIVREMSEELGIAVETVGEPFVQHRRDPRRVEYFYRLSLVGCRPVDAYAASPELVEVGWFDLETINDLDQDDSVSEDALRALAD